MLHRFLRIRIDLIAVCENEGLDLCANSSAPFRHKVEQYCGHMQQIEYVMKELPAIKLPFSICQNILNMLVADVKTGVSDNESPFYLCFLKDKYTSRHSKLLENPTFRSAPAKFKRNGSLR